MFTIDKKEYRNLQEQVLKNKEDIAAHYAIDRVLAEFGIRVIGVMPTYDALIEQHGDYQGEYGDAFAVGTEPPYIFYIWTRPDPAAGHDTAYWFDVGELAIVGPQGPQGPKGDKGDTGASTRWFVITNYTELTQEPYRSMAPGNIAIIDGFTWETGEYSGLHGQTYIKEATAWIAGPNLRGPQGLTGNTGPTGAKGDKGDKGDPGAPGPAGPIVVIKGIITSMSQLDGVIPSAPNDAYLLEENNNKYIIGLVNNNWTNLGIFAGGTLVTINGLIQNEWNADTKVDKVTTTGGRRVYGITGSGTPDIYTLRPDIAPNPNYQIVVRDSNGQVTVPQTPTNNTDAASKRYIDNLIANNQIFNHTILLSADLYGDTLSCRIFDTSNVSIAYTRLSDLNLGYYAVNGTMKLSETIYLITEIHRSASQFEVDGISLVDGQFITQIFNDNSITTFQDTPRWSE